MTSKRKRAVLLSHLLESTAGTIAPAIQTPTDPVLFNPATAQVGDLLNNRTGWAMTYEDTFRDPAAFSAASSLDNQSAKYKSNLFFDPQIGAYPTTGDSRGPRSLFESQGLFSDPLYNSINPFEITADGLIIKARAMSSATQALAPNGMMPISTGNLTTEVGKPGYTPLRPRGFSQRFGFWECRMRCDVTKGNFPSFWLWPRDDYNSANPDEIDVVEAHGTRGGMYTHGWHRRHVSEPYDITNENLSLTGTLDQFHTFGVYWDDTHLIYTLDGVISEIFTDHRITQEMYWIISFAIGIRDWFNNGVDSADLATFSSNMYVDFVRVWQVPGISAPPEPIVYDPGPVYPVPRIGTELIVNNPGQAAPSNHEYFSTVGGIFGGFYRDNVQLHVGVAKGGLPVPCVIDGDLHTWQGLGYYGQRTSGGTVLCDVGKTYFGRIWFEYGTAPWFQLAIDIGGSTQRIARVFPNNSWEYGFQTDGTKGLIPRWVGPDPVTGVQLFEFEWTPQPDSGVTSTTLDLRIGPAVNDATLTSIIYKMSLAEMLPPANEPSWNALGQTNTSYPENAGTGVVVDQITNITPGGVLLQLADNAGNRLKLNVSNQVLISSTVTNYEDSYVADATPAHTVKIGVQQVLNGFTSPTQWLTYDITDQTEAPIDPVRRYKDPSKYSVVGLSNNNSWTTNKPTLQSDQPVWGTQSMFDSWPVGQPKPKLIVYQGTFSRYPVFCTAALRRLEEYYGYKANAVMGFMGYPDWNAFVNTSPVLDDYRYQIPIDPKFPTLGERDMYDDFILAVPITVWNTPMQTVVDNGNVTYNGDTYPVKTPFMNLFQHMIGRGILNPIVRLGWEFNGGWNPWATTNANAPTFIAAWRQIVAWAREARTDVNGVSTGFSNFRTCWNPVPNSGLTNLASAYPGDDVVTYIGMDLYNAELNNNWPNYQNINSNLLTTQQLSDRFEWTNWGRAPGDPPSSKSGGGGKWLKWFAENTNGLISGTAAGTTVYRTEKKPIMFPELGTGFKKNTTPGGNGTGGEDDGVYWTKMLDIILNPANNVYGFCPWEMPASDYWCRSREGAYWTGVNPSSANDVKPNTFAAMTPRLRRL